MVKIFVIHREPTALPVLRRRLQMPNAIVEGTHYVVGAAEQVQDFQPDILLVSGNLADGEGADALRAIYQSGYKKAVTFAISSDVKQKFNEAIVAVGQEFGQIIHVVKDGIRETESLREAMDRHGPLFP